ncbi:uncharacterized protein Z518_01592 [Rhinocladiella mackenziei CBS 650.93]|uniref:Uncharacterized protein n=1 Tax=Rhinocladiella mackenziei CBS 650.93 TaxID=1442369 RepID=A0A0D2IX06_9EURO|nr:uncharacterized protein Z518_01592 [Rhinocladiella mackenziei CBS 650.93]KIX10509.1 hypothetical protein Z518_01592 [Rhinocladiella mackenziei CBS 650.93]
MSSYGLDLQHLYSNTINLDIPISRAIRDQADHRFRRFGQTRQVVSWNLSMKGTANDRRLVNNLGKAIPHVASELNGSIFDIQSGVEEGEPFSIGEWIIYNGELMKPDGPSTVVEAGDDPPRILEPRRSSNKFFTKKKVGGLTQAASTILHHINFRWYRPPFFQPITAL